MKMNVFIRTAALMAAVAVSAPAFAGGMTVAEKDDSKLKVEAKVFVSAVNRKDSSAGVTTIQSQSVNLDRAYLGIKYYFDDDWMMRITYDAAAETGKLGKAQNVFLKYAYLEGKLAGDAAVLRLGQSHTPWIDYEQGLWKHRYVSKVMIDEYKMDSSSDLGVGLKGKVDMFNYFVTVSNGNGYGAPTTNKGNNAGLDFNARVGVEPIKGLTIDAGMKSGYNGTKLSAVNGAAAVAGTKQDMTQFMVTYGMGHDFRVGANYINSKSTPAAAVGVTTKGYGIWGWANVMDNFGAFARVENLKDNTAGAVKTDRTVFGLEFTPRKHVNLSLVTDNSKTGTKKTDIVGLYSQFKF